MAKKSVEAFDEAEVSSNETLQSLLKLARELIKLEEQIKADEIALKAKTGRATELKTQLLPDAMAEAGLAAFTTPDGPSIKIEDFVSGSLPKDPAKRDAAVKELVALDGEELIKNEVFATFGKSQHNAALAAAEQLREAGLDVEVRASVHPQSLLAFVREKLRSGDQIDPEKLGVFVGRKAKVTL